MKTGNVMIGAVSKQPKWKTMKKRPATYDVYYNEIEDGEVVKKRKSFRDMKEAYDFSETVDLRYVDQRSALVW